MNCSDISYQEPIVLAIGVSILGLTSYKLYSFYKKYRETKKCVLSIRAIINGNMVHQTTLKIELDHDKEIKEYCKTNLENIQRATLSNFLFSYGKMISNPKDVQPKNASVPRCKYCYTIILDSNNEVSCNKVTCIKCSKLCCCWCVNVSELHQCDIEEETLPSCKIQSIIPL